MIHNLKKLAVCASIGHAMFGYFDKKGENRNRPDGRLFAHGIGVTSLGISSGLIICDFILKGPARTIPIAFFVAGTCQILAKKMGSGLANLEDRQPFMSTGPRSSGPRPS